MTRVELAYRIVGRAWRRRTFTSDAACQLWLEKMYDQYGPTGFEVRFTE